MDKDEAKEIEIFFETLGAKIAGRAKPYAAEGYDDKVHTSLTVLSELAFSIADAASMFSFEPDEDEDARA